jgi:hypothetical protein
MFTAKIYEIHLGLNVYFIDLTVAASWFLTPERSERFEMSNSRQQRTGESGLSSEGRSGQTPDEFPDVIAARTRDDPPYPVEEIRENVRALDLPVAFEHVDGVGESRASELHECGLRDMVDFALVSWLGDPPIEVARVLDGFSERVEQRLRRVAKEINDDAILAADEDGDIGRVSEEPPGDFWVPVPATHSSPTSVAVKLMQRRGVERCRSVDIVSVDDERRAVIRDPVLEADQ